jgi:hypothetical protein
MHPNFHEWDLAFRPADYLVPPGPLQAMLVNVKGSSRRDAIRLQVQRGEPVPEELLGTELDWRTRAVLAQQSPRLLRGEDLPPYRRGEVEIARVTLAAASDEVISIRAARGPSRIRYRVVDEFGTRWSCAPRSSRRPLTLAAMLGLLRSLDDRGTGGDFLARHWREQAEAGCAAAEVIGWLTVDSDFYPQLGGWVEAASWRWVRDYLAARARHEPSREEAPEG